MRKKLEYAPAACPRCQRKDGWAVVNNPLVPKPTRMGNILDGLEAGILGMLIGAFIPLTRKVEYHCWNCDFRETFKQKR